MEWSWWSRHHKCHSVRSVWHQRLWDKLGWLLKRVFLAHRYPHGVNDETKDRTWPGCCWPEHQGHPPQDAEAVFFWRKNPDCPCRDFAVKRALPRYAARKALPRACITAGGIEALEDKSPKPGRVWNRIPDNIRKQIVDLALEEPELSPRELAVRFTDTQSYFVSEASVYRLLKAHDLITSPAFVVIKAASEFRDKTTAINQMWQILA